MLEKYDEFNLTYIRGYVTGVVGIVLPMIIIVVVAYL